jgi:serine O-acetyltransferase
MLKEDALRTYNAAQGRRLDRIIACCRSPGLHAVAVYRFGHWLKHANLVWQVLLSPIYLMLFRRVRIKWGIEIPRSAEIGPGLFIGHFGGVVVASEARIGSNVDISHQVTIGISGQGEKRGCPIVGDNVYIAPGAKLFGKIRIGNNVKIGANAVVYKDVPDNAVVVLDPGFRIIAFTEPASRPAEPPLTSERGDDVRGERSRREDTPVQRGGGHARG